MFFYYNKYKGDIDVEVYYKFVKIYLKKYLEISKFCEIKNYNLVDVFYWEFFMGIWYLVSVLLEIDYVFDIYILINC